MAKITLEDAIARADVRFKEYVGQLTEFESAIGALIVGRHLGWRVMLLIHDRRTITKYEKILGINFREELPEEGPLSHKSIAWTYIKKIRGIYWKVVRGEAPIENKGIVTGV